MRLFYYLKSTLKAMVANGAITILYFIGFPIILAAFMGFVRNTAHDTALKLKPLNINIVDQDNTEMSKKLEDFLKSNEMKEVVNIVDSKPEVEVIIQKGYEKNLLSLNKDEVIINKKEEGFTYSTNTLKIVLDKYHQSVYVQMTGGSIEELNRVIGKSIIEEEIIEFKKTASEFEKTVVSMIGVVISMLIFSSIQGGYSDISVNMENRINAAPFTRVQFLLYETASLLVYALIVLAVYVSFFRITGIAYRGNILGLAVLVMTAAVLVVSIVKFITTLFGAKYGKVFGMIIFILPIAGGELFTGKESIIALFTPTHYLNNAFLIYNLHGSLNDAGKWILMILAASGILFSIAVIKESLRDRRKLCV